MRMVGFMYSDIEIACTGRLHMSSNSGTNIYEGMDIYICMRVLQLLIAERFLYLGLQLLRRLLAPSSLLCAAFPSNPTSTLTVFSFTSSSSVKLSCCTGHSHPWKGQSPRPEVPADAFHQVWRGRSWLSLNLALNKFTIVFSLLPSDSFVCHSHHDKVRISRATACTFAMGAKAQWLCRHNGGDWYRTKMGEFMSVHLRFHARWFAEATRKT